MSEIPQFSSFFFHLTELRDRLLKAFAAFILATAIVWNFIDPVIEFIVRPVGKIIFTSPAEAFNARVTLSMIGGLFLAFPIIIYQLWKFVSSGLTAEEKKHVKFFGPLSFIFFFAGVSFGYFVVFPLSLNFLMSFSNQWMVPMIMVDKYISFVGMVLVASGVTFQLPLVLVFFIRIGVATPEFLREKRRYAIVIILILAAVLTPPDVVSQIILAVPLLILYELGIFFSRWTAVKRKRIFCQEDLPLGF